MRWLAVLLCVALAIDGLLALKLLHPLGSPKSPGKKQSRSASDVEVGLSKDNGLTLSQTQSRAEHSLNKHQESSNGRKVSEAQDGSSYSELDSERQRTEQTEENLSEQRSQSLGIGGRNGLLQSQQTYRNTGDETQYIDEYNRESFSSQDQNGAYVRYIDSEDESGNSRRQTNTYDEESSKSTGIGWGGLTKHQSGSRTSSNTDTANSFKRNQRTEEEISKDGRSNRRSVTSSNDENEDFQGTSAHTDYNNNQEQSNQVYENQDLSNGNYQDGSGQYNIRQNLGQIVPQRGLKRHSVPIPHIPNQRSFETIVNNQNGNDNGNYGRLSGIIDRFSNSDGYIGNLGTSNGGHINRVLNHAQNSEQLLNGRQRPNHVASGTGNRQGPVKYLNQNHGIDTSKLFARNGYDTDADQEFNEDVSPGRQYINAERPGYLDSDVFNQGLDTANFVRDIDNQANYDSGYESADISDDFSRVFNDRLNNKQIVTGPVDVGDDSVQYLPGIPAPEGRYQGSNAEDDFNRDSNAALYRNINDITRHGNTYPRPNRKGDLGRALNHGVHKPQFISGIPNQAKFVNGVLVPTDGVKYIPENGYRSNLNEYLKGPNRARGAVNYLGTGTANQGPVSDKYINNVLVQESNPGQYIGESQDTNSKRISEILTQAQRLLKHEAIPKAYETFPTQYHPSPNKRKPSVHRTPYYGKRLYDAPTGSYMASPSSSYDDDYEAVAPIYVGPSVIAPGLNGYPNGHVHKPSHHKNSGLGTEQINMPGTDQRIPTTIFGSEPVTEREGHVSLIHRIPVRNGANKDEKDDKTYTTETNDYDSGLFDDADDGTSGDTFEIIIDRDRLLKHDTNTYKSDRINKKVGTVAKTVKDLTSKVRQGNIYVNSDIDDTSKIVNRENKITKIIENDGKSDKTGKEDERPIKIGKSIVNTKTTDEGEKLVNVKNLEENKDNFIFTNNDDNDSTKKGTVIVIDKSRLFNSSYKDENENENTQKTSSVTKNIFKNGVGSNDVTLTKIPTYIDGSKGKVNETSTEIDKYLKTYDNNKEVTDINNNGNYGKSRLIDNGIGKPNEKTTVITNTYKDRSGNGKIQESSTVTTKSSFADDKDDKSIQNGTSVVIDKTNVGKTSNSYGNNGKVNETSTEDKKVPESDDNTRPNKENNNEAITNNKYTVDDKTTVNNIIGSNKKPRLPDKTSDESTKNDNVIIITETEVIKKTYDVSSNESKNKTAPESKTVLIYDDNSSVVDNKDNQTIKYSTSVNINNTSGNKNTLKDKTKNDEPHKPSTKTNEVPEIYDIYKTDASKNHYFVKQGSLIVDDKIRAIEYQITKHAKKTKAVTKNVNDSDNDDCDDDDDDYDDDETRKVSVTNNTVTDGSSNNKKSNVEDISKNIKNITDLIDNKNDRTVKNDTSTESDKSAKIKTTSKQISTDEKTNDILTKINDRLESDDKSGLNGKKYTGTIETGKSIVDSKNSLVNNTATEGGDKTVESTTIIIRNVTSFGTEDDEEDDDEDVDNDNNETSEVIKTNNTKRDGLRKSDETNKDYNDKTVKNPIKDEFNGTTTNEYDCDSYDEVLDKVSTEKKTVVNKNDKPNKTKKNVKPKKGDVSGKDRSIVNVNQGFGDSGSVDKPKEQDTVPQKPNEVSQTDSIVNKSDDFHMYNGPTTGKPDSADKRNRKSGHNTKRPSKNGTILGGKGNKNDNGTDSEDSVTDVASTGGSTVTNITRGFNQNDKDTNDADKKAYSEYDHFQSNYEYWDDDDIEGDNDDTDNVPQKPNELSQTEKPVTTSTVDNENNVNTTDEFNGTTTDDNDCESDDFDDEVSNNVNADKNKVNNKNDKPNKTKKNVKPKKGDVSGKNGPIVNVNQGFGDSGSVDKPKEQDTVPRKPNEVSQTDSIVNKSDDFYIYNGPTTGKPDSANKRNRKSGHNPKRPTKNGTILGGKGNKNDNGTDSEDSVTDVASTGGSTVTNITQGFNQTDKDTNDADKKAYSEYDHFQSNNEYWDDADIEGDNDDTDNVPQKPNELSQTEKPVTTSTVDNENNVNTTDEFNSTTTDDNDCESDDFDDEVSNNVNADKKKVNNKNDKPNKTKKNVKPKKGDVSGKDGPIVNVNQGFGDSGSVDKPKEQDTVPRKPNEVSQTDSIVNKSDDFYIYNGPTTGKPDSANKRNRKSGHNPKRPTKNGTILGGKRNKNDNGTDSEDSVTDVASTGGSTVTNITQGFNQTDKDTNDADKKAYSEYDHFQSNNEYWDDADIEGDNDDTDNVPQKPNELSQTEKPVTTSTVDNENNVNTTDEFNSTTTDDNDCESDDFDDEVSNNVNADKKKVNNKNDKPNKTKKNVKPKKGDVSGKDGPIVNVNQGFGDSGSVDKPKEQDTVPRKPNEVSQTDSIVNKSDDFYIYNGPTTGKPDSANKRNRKSGHNPKRPTKNGTILGGKGNKNDNGTDSEDSVTDVASTGGSTVTKITRGFNQNDKDTNDADKKAYSEYDHFQSNYEYWDDDDIEGDNDDTDNVPQKPNEVSQTEKPVTTSTVDNENNVNTTDEFNGTTTDDNDCESDDFDDEVSNNVNADKKKVNNKNDKPNKTKKNVKPKKGDVSGKDGPIVNVNQGFGDSGSVDKPKEQDTVPRKPNEVSQTDSIVNKSDDFYIYNGPTTGKPDSANKRNRKSGHNPKRPTKNGTILGGKGNKNDNGTDSEDSVTDVASTGGSTVTNITRGFNQNDKDTNDADKKAYSEYDHFQSNYEYWDDDDIEGDNDDTDNVPQKPNELSQTEKPVTTSTVDNENNVNTTDEFNGTTTDDNDCESDDFDDEVSNNVNADKNKVNNKNDKPNKTKKNVKPKKGDVSGKDGPIVNVNQGFGDSGSVDKPKEQDTVPRKPNEVSQTDSIVNKSDDFYIYNGPTTGKPDSANKRNRKSGHNPKRPTKNGTILGGKGNKNDNGTDSEDSVTDVASTGGSTVTNITRGFNQNDKDTNDADKKAYSEYDHFQSNNEYWDDADIEGDNDDTDNVPQKPNELSQTEKPVTTSTVDNENNVNTTDEFNSTTTDDNDCESNDFDDEVSNNVSADKKKVNNKNDKPNKTKKNVKPKKGDVSGKDGPIVNVNQGFGDSGSVDKPKEQDTVPRKPNEVSQTDSIVNKSDDFYIYNGPTTGKPDSANKRNRKSGHNPKRPTKNATILGGKGNKNDNGTDSEDSVTDVASTGGSTVTNITQGFNQNDKDTNDADKKAYSEYDHFQSNNEYWDDADIEGDNDDTDNVPQKPNELSQTEKPVTTSTVDNENNVNTTDEFNSTTTDDNDCESDDFDDEVSNNVNADKNKVNNKNDKPNKTKKNVKPKKGDVSGKDGPIVNVNQGFGDSGSVDKPKEQDTVPRKPNEVSQTDSIVNKSDDFYIYNGPTTGKPDSANKRNRKSGHNPKRPTKNGTILGGKGNKNDNGTDSEDSVTDVASTGGSTVTNITRGFNQNDKDTNDADKKAYSEYDHFQSNYEYWDDDDIEGDNDDTDNVPQKPNEVSQTEKPVTTSTVDNENNVNTTDEFNGTTTDDNDCESDDFDDEVSNNVNADKNKVNNKNDKPNKTKKNVKPKKGDVSGKDGPIVNVNQGFGDSGPVDKPKEQDTVPRKPNEVSQTDSIVNKSDDFYIYNGPTTGKPDSANKRNRKSGHNPKRPTKNGTILGGKGNKNDNGTDSEDSVTDVASTGGSTVTNITRGFNQNDKDTNDADKKAYSEYDHFQSNNEYWDDADIEGDNDDTDNVPQKPNEVSQTEKPVTTSTVDNENNVNTTDEFNGTTTDDNDCESDDFDDEVSNNVNADKNKVNNKNDKPNKTKKNVKPKKGDVSGKDGPIVNVNQGFGDSGSVDKPKEQDTVPRRPNEVSQTDSIVNKSDDFYIYNGPTTGKPDSANKRNRKSGHNPKRPTKNGTILGGKGNKNDNGTDSEDSVTDVASTGGSTVTNITRGFNQNDKDTNDADKKAYSEYDHFQSNYEYWDDDDIEGDNDDTDNVPQKPNEVSQTEKPVTTSTVDNENNVNTTDEFNGTTTDDNDCESDDFDDEVSNNVNADKKKVNNKNDKPNKTKKNVKPKKGDVSGKDGPIVNVNQGFGDSGSVDKPKEQDTVPRKPNEVSQTDSIVNKSDDFYIYNGPTTGKPDSANKRNRKSGHNPKRPTKNGTILGGKGNKNDNGTDSEDSVTDVASTGGSTVTNITRGFNQNNKDTNDADKKAYSEYDHFQSNNEYWDDADIEGDNDDTDNVPQKPNELSQTEKPVTTSTVDNENNVNTTDEFNGTTTDDNDCESDDFDDEVSNNVNADKKKVNNKNDKPNKTKKNVKPKKGDVSGKDGPIVNGNQGFGDSGSVDKPKEQDTVPRKPNEVSQTDSIVNKSDDFYIYNGPTTGKPDSANKRNRKSGHNPKRPTKNGTILGGKGNKNDNGTDSEDSVTDVASTGASTVTNITRGFNQNDKDTNVADKKAYSEYDHFQSNYEYWDDDDIEGDNDDTDNVPQKPNEVSQTEKPVTTSTVDNENNVNTTDEFNGTTTDDNDCESDDFDDEVSNNVNADKKKVNNKNDKPNKTKKNVKPKKGDVSGKDGPIVNVNQGFGDSGSIDKPKEQDTVPQKLKEVSQTDEPVATNTVNNKNNVNETDEINGTTTDQYDCDSYDEVFDKVSTEKKTVVNKNDKQPKNKKNVKPKTGDVLGKGGPIINVDQGFGNSGSVDKPYEQDTVPQKPNEVSQTDSIVNKSDVFNIYNGPTTGKPDSAVKRNRKSSQKHRGSIKITTKLEGKRQKNDHGTDYVNRGNDLTSKDGTTVTNIKPSFDQIGKDKNDDNKKSISKYGDLPRYKDCDDDAVHIDKRSRTNIGKKDIKHTNTHKIVGEREQKKDYGLDSTTSESDKSSKDGKSGSVKDATLTVFTKPLSSKNNRRSTKVSRRGIKAKKELELKNITYLGNDDGNKSEDGKLTDFNKNTVIKGNKHTFRTINNRIKINNNTFKNSKKTIYKHTDKNRNNVKTIPKHGEEDNDCENNKDVKPVVTGKPIKNRKQRKHAANAKNASNNKNIDNKGRVNKSKNNNKTKININDKEQKETILNSSTSNIDDKKVKVTDISNDKVKTIRSTKNNATKNRKPKKSKLVPITTTIEQHKSNLNNGGVNNVAGSKNTTISGSNNNTEQRSDKNTQQSRVKDTEQRSEKTNVSDRNTKQRTEKTNGSQTNIEQRTDNSNDSDTNVKKRAEKKSSDSNTEQITSRNDSDKNTTSGSESNTDKRTENTNNSENCDDEKSRTFSSSSDSSDHSTPEKQSNNATKSSGSKKRKSKYSKTASESGSGSGEESSTIERNKITYIKTSEDTDHSEQQETLMFTEETEDSIGKKVESGKKSSSEEANKSSSDSLKEESDNNGNKKIEKNSSTSEYEQKQEASSNESKTVDSNGNTAVKSNNRRRSSKSQNTKFSKTEEETKTE